MSKSSAVVMVCMIVSLAGCGERRQPTNDAQRIGESLEQSDSDTFTFDDGSSLRFVVLPRATGKLCSPVGELPADNPYTVESVEAGTAMAADGTPDESTVEIEATVTGNDC
jgi:hypothetical protein